MGATGIFVYETWDYQYDSMVEHGMFKLFVRSKLGLHIDYNVPVL